MLTRTPNHEIQTPSEYRHPPHNIEAEQALLGALFIHNAAFERVEFLSPEHFFDRLHGQIFEVLGKVIRAGKAATPVTVKHFFESAEPFDEDLTVPQYLGRLAANATSVINTRDYAQAIYDLAVRRSLIELGEDIVNSAYDAPVDFPPDSQIQEAESRLGQLARTGSDDQVVPLASVLGEVLDQASKAYERDGGLAGLPTGLADLDRKLGGLGDADLVIIAGRPSMGKTALATTIAWNIAKERSRSSDGEIVANPVDFYSLEMSRSQLGSRLLAMHSEIPTERVRRGMISEEEFRKLVLHTEHIAKTPLYIDHRGGLSIETFRARARRQARKSGARLIVVDYLQLMHSTIYRGKNRVQEITEITNGLKALAKELNIPVVALSQLSRDLEKRDDKRPMLSDLRDSGSIEQDADVVIFCYRDEYYLERKKPHEGTTEFNDWQGQMIAVAGKAEAIIAKNRMGPIGTVELAFDGALTRFSDLAKTYQLPERHQ